MVCVVILVSLQQKKIIIKKNQKSEKKERELDLCGHLNKNFNFTQNPRNTWQQ